MLVVHSCKLQGHITHEWEGYLGDEGLGCYPSTRHPTPLWQIREGLAPQSWQKLLNGGASTHKFFFLSFCKAQNQSLWDHQDFIYLFLIAKIFVGFFTHNRRQLLLTESICGQWSKFEREGRSTHFASIILLAFWGALVTPLEDQKTAKWRKENRGGRVAKILKPSSF